MKHNKPYLNYLCLFFLLVLSSQNISGQAFVTIWKTDNFSTSSLSNQITIPTIGSGYNYNVDWGDGTADTGVTGDITHTYATIGTYTVSITGDFPRIYLNGGSTGAFDSRKLISIEQWGNIAWESMESAFSGAFALQLNASDAPDLSLVKNVSNMFSWCIALNQPSSNWNWDVSSIINMSGMFERTSTFNVNISSWDVSNVTNMSNMFNSSRFDGAIGVWDVGEVTNMSGMFQNTSRFNQNINTWDVGKVTDMSFMFEKAGFFNSSVSSWDVSNVINMESLFDSSGYSQPLTNWNVSNVNNMKRMFAQCRTFNRDLSLWDVSKVVDMREMFNRAPAFNTNIGDWNVSNVTNMGGMFAQAIIFNQDLNSWNVGNVINMSNMFSGASAFNGNISSWDVINVIEMSNMFSSTNFNTDISSWNVASVTNMSGMFFDSRFNQPIGNWNVSNVTTMNQMFSGSGFNQPIENWDVSNVTTMNQMFSGVTLSTTNYDSLLIAWDILLNKQSNVGFDGGNSQYCEGGKARINLITNNSWIITDGGPIPDGISPTAITQDVIIQLDGSGNISITPEDINNGSTDNCSIVSLSLDQTDFTCADLGANTITLTITDAAGNNDTATAQVTVLDNMNICPSLSTSENILNKTVVSLYPNPANNSFSIETNKIIEHIDIYSFQGEMVKSFDTQLSNYNIEELNSGIYFVKIKSVNDVFIRKLIKELN